MFNKYFDVPGYWGVPNTAWGILIPLAILDLVLRGYALWRSARSGQNVWFVALLIVNSLGILPAIYLLINKDKTKTKK